jgi:CheY-like chemotaxis protein
MTLRGKRILVVEDEMLIAMRLESEVAGLGGKVITAASVDAALDIIASTELDGATVDLKLRGQRSFSVADALAARHVPFVFATALMRSDIPDRYANVPWLGKPLRPQDVFRALECAMSRPQEPPG